MHPIVIGITGAAGAGKDTVAVQLVARMLRAGHASERISMADPIRAMLAAMGVPWAYMQERRLKEVPVPGFAGRSYRHLAQTLGTEWGRTLVGDELWLDIATQRVTDAAREAAPGHFVAIVSDVRFPNEARWLRRLGGTLIRIDRPGLAPVAAHSSEDHYAHMASDVDLHNNGSLGDLARTVDELADGLFTWARERQAASVPAMLEGVRS